MSVQTRFNRQSFLRIKSRFLNFFAAAGLCLCLAACNATMHKPHFVGPAEQDQVIAAQEEQVRDREVTITARVKRVLPDDTKGSQHQRLLIGLANGTTVLIAHNIDEAEKVPVTEGDTITVHGVYIWNEKVASFTGRTTAQAAIRAVILSFKVNDTSSCF